jgi:hypothetical protein
MVSSLAALALCCATAAVLAAGDDETVRFDFLVEHSFSQAGDDFRPRGRCGGCGGPAVVGRTARLTSARAALLQRCDGVPQGQSQRSGQVRRVHADGAGPQGSKGERSAAAAAAAAAAANGVRMVRPWAAARHRQRRCLQSAHHARRHLRHDLRQGGASALRGRCAPLTSPPHSAQCHLAASGFRELFTLHTDIYGNVVALEYRPPITDCARVPIKVTPLHGMQGWPHSRAANQVPTAPTALKSKAKLSFGRPGEKYAPPCCAHRGVHTACSAGERARRPRDTREVEAMQAKVQAEAATEKGFFAKYVSGRMLRAPFPSAAVLPLHRGHRSRDPRC